MRVDGRFWGWLLTFAGGIEDVVLVGECVRYNLAFVELRPGYDIVLSIFQASGIEAVVASSVLSDQRMYTREAMTAIASCVSKHHQVGST